MSSSTKETFQGAHLTQSFKKKDLSLLSNDMRKSANNTKSMTSQPFDCLFCTDEFSQNTKLQFSAMVNKALYSKYSSSQNYYYTKDINEILSGDSRTSAVIMFKDFLAFDEEDEYLKRFYHSSEYDFKIKMLTEYYKFHNDIARIFMMPVSNVLNKYHDKKRRLEYVRITKMLKEQGGEDETEPKQTDTKNDFKEFIITDRILDDLDGTDTEHKKPKRNPSNARKGSQPLLSKSPPQQDMKMLAKKTVTNKNVAGKNAGNMDKKKGGATESLKDASISNTINDLNLKLGEIINSRSNVERSYLENSEIQANETISNLNNFLLFMDKNQKNTGKITDIPKIEHLVKTKKMVSSAPITERNYRPDSALSTNRQKQTPKGDLMSKVNDPMSRMGSANSSKMAVAATNKQGKPGSKLKERGEGTLSKQRSTQDLIEKQKGNVVTKIKNFEEAMKINIPGTQKLAVQSSLPRDLQEKVASSKNTNRAAGTKTPAKQKGETSRESSITRQRAQQLYSSTLTRPTSRIKTKSTDMYTKALDLLLGNNQILMGGNNTSSKKEKEGYSHRNTKSSFNFKLKVSSQGMLSQEKSVGKDDPVVLTNNRVASAKVSTEKERIYLNTDRESKKIGTLGNMDILKKEILQVPLTEREMSKDYVAKDKDAGKLSSKMIIKAMAPVTNGTENIKPGLAAYMEQKKLGYHKYTKSEGRLKKPEEKIESANSSTKALLSGTGSTRTKPLKDGHSPRRQNYTYNHNNIVNVFLSANNDKRFDKTITLKTDRYQNPEILVQNESENLSKVFKSRSPNTDLMNKLNQNHAKKLQITNHDLDYKNFEFSPLKVLQKDGSTNHTRVLSDKSPPSMTTGFQQRRNNASRGFEMLRRDLRFDNFDSQGSRSKEKL